MGEYEVPNVRGDSVIGQAGVSLGNAFLREADNLGSFISEQLAQSQRGAGSQRRRQYMLCFVGVAGHSQAERKLGRGM